MNQYFSCMTSLRAVGRLINERMVQRGLNVQNEKLMGAEGNDLNEMIKFTVPL